MATPISSEVLNQEADARFWAQTGYKPGRKLDPTNLTDKAMVPVWMDIFRKVQGEARAGRLVTTYDHPRVAQALSDAEVADQAAAVHVAAAAETPNPSLAQDNVAAATTASQVSVQRAREAAVDQPPTVNPEIVQRAGQEAAAAPPPPQAPPAEHIAHAHVRNRAHAHARGIHTQAREALYKETNARFWNQTHYKPGQSLDMSIEQDRKMAKVWLEIFHRVQGEAVRAPSRSEPSLPPPLSSPSPPRPGMSPSGPPVVVPPRTVPPPSAPQRTPVVPPSGLPRIPGPLMTAPRPTGPFMGPMGPFMGPWMDPSRGMGPQMPQMPGPSPMSPPAGPLMGPAGPPMGPQMPGPSSRGPSMGLPAGPAGPQMPGPPSRGPSMSPPAGPLMGPAGPPMGPPVGPAGPLMGPPRGPTPPHEPVEPSAGPPMGPLERPAPVAPSGDLGEPPSTPSREPVPGAPIEESSGVGKYIALGLVVIAAGGALYYASTRVQPRTTMRVSTPRSRARKAFMSPRAPIPASASMARSMAAQRAPADESETELEE